MLDKILCLFVIVTCYQVTNVNAAVKIENCGAKFGKVGSVTLPTCGKGPVCSLVRGENATVGIEFKPIGVVENVTVQLLAEFNGMLIEIPMPASEKDGCQEEYGLTCPLKAGETYNFHKNQYVKPSTPKIHGASVIYKLVDDKQQELVCVKFPVQVVDAEKVKST